jgi:hypothetical protein
MKAREEELRKQAKSRPPIQHLPVQAASVMQAEAVPAHNLRQRPGKHVFLVCCVALHILTRGFSVIAFLSFPFLSQVTDAVLRSTTVALPGGYNSRSTQSMLPPAPRSGNDRLPYVASTKHKLCALTHYYVIFKIQERLFNHSRTTAAKCQQKVRSSITLCGKTRWPTR